MQKVIGSRRVQKVWAYLGVILMLGLNFGPFFNFLNFPQHANANATTTWTKSLSNPVINSAKTAYPRVLKEASAFWSTQNVNTALGALGGQTNTSIVLDSSNHIHIVYFDDATNNLKYAYYDGSSWTNTTVELIGGFVIASPAIALDSSNNIYISYYGSNEKLKYAKSINNGTSWTTATIEVNDQAGQYSAIAIDSSNNIHISYFDFLNSALKYAKSTNGGTSWDYVTVDDSANVGGNSSIAVNSSGQARISYYDDTNDDLKYASYNGATWDVSTIASAQDSGNPSSIAIDSSNNARIVYRNDPDGTTTDNLNYIYYNGASWSSPETIESGANIATGASSKFLVMDASNNLYVSYKVGASSSWDLKYAVNTGSWSTTTIDSTGTSGMYNSIDLDSSNNPYISYYSDTTYSAGTAVLKYAVGGQNYKLWSEQSVGGDKNYYATSADGINWAPLQNIKNEISADFNAHEASIIKDSSTYKMWYNAATGTKYRESSDGINWGAETSCSFDVTEAWDGDRITPFVFKDGSTYKMYYNANEGSTNNYIAYATSVNGTSWIEPQNLGQIADVSTSTNNNLVLKQGSSGQWDGYQTGEALYSVHVLKNTGGTYEMFYGGNTDGSINKIGYATSADGITWTKSGSNPVIPDGAASTWDDTGALYPSVIEDGATYKMWYTNNWAGKLGYAAAPAESGDVIAPTITNVSSGVANGYYNAGDIVDIDVTFSEAVTSTGNVTVTLETGVNDRMCTFTVSNATTGTCDYTVQAEDISADLTVKTIAGTIKDQSDNPMTNFAPATNLAANKAIVIDTTNPAVSFTNDVAAGPVSSDTIIITVSDTNADSATYEYGYSADATCNGSDTYGNTFTSGSSFTISTATNNGKYICAKATDLAGNITYQASANDLNIDTGIPTITGVTSEKANGNYTVGEVIDIDVTFSEAVTSTGDVTVTLETGDTDRTCTFAVSNSTTASCNYTVSAGDTSADLTVKTIAGTIKDQADNAITDFAPATNLATNKALVIDTTNPTAPATIYDGVDTTDDVWTNSLTTLTANWTASTDTGGTGIQKYQYAIGTTSGGTDVVNWTDNVSPTVTKAGLTLTNGQIYYFSVRAVDNAGNTSTAANSSGITVDTTNPTASLALNDYYNADNWPAGGISGTAADAASGVASTQITIQRSSDSKYWDGDSWEVASTPLSATGTTSWAYSFSSGNLTNGSAYRITARSTDNVGNNSSYANDTFVYNNHNWVKSSLNPSNGFYNFATFFNNLFDWLLGDSLTIQVESEASRFVSSDYMMYGSVMRGTVGDIILMGLENKNKAQFKRSDIQNGDINGYGMWFSRNDNIYLAISPNGADWFSINNYDDIDLGDLEELNSGPVMTLGASGTFDDYAIFEPHVIWDDVADKYKMWYVGSSDANTPSIGYAESIDGVTWTNRQQVMTTGAGGTWDYGLVRNPRVVQISSTDYRMWYVGNSIKSPDSGWDSGWQIGYATSTDGISWSKSGSNPVLTKGVDPAWDYANDWSFDVLKRGSNYEMFFSGNGSDTKYKIGHAYSEDGVTWKKYDSNPIVSGTADAWDTNGIYSPMVAYISDTNTYEMFYFGENSTNKINLGRAIMDAPADATLPYSILAVPNEETEFFSDSTWMSDIVGLAYDANGINKVDVRISYQSGGTTYYWNGTTWTTLESWKQTTPILGWLFWKYDLDKSNLTGGVTYTINSRATDGNTNIETNITDDSQAQFTYDDSAPSAPTVSDGTGTDIDQVESLTTLSANWTAAADAQSGIDHYEYAIGTTSGGTNVVSWTDNGTARTLTRSNLSLSMDQAYYVSVKAENGAGTYSLVATSDGQTVVDLTAPTLSLTTYPSTPTNDSTPQFAGSTTDSMTNISAIQYKIDSGSWIAVDAGDGVYNELTEEFNFNSSTLSEGSHTIYFRALDVKSNASSATSVTFVVDTTAPSAPGISLPTNGSTISDSTPTLSGTAEVNSTVLLTISSDPKSYTTTANSNGDWAYTIPDVDALTAGSHSLEVKARDGAGNTSSGSTITFSVVVASNAVETTGATAVRTTAQATPSPVVSQEPTITETQTTVTISQVSVPVVSQNQNIEVFANASMNVSINPSSNKEVNNISLVFEGKTFTFLKQADGKYQTTLLAPNAKGTYQTKATIVYKDGSTEEVNINVLVDPYGYVYEKNKVGEQHLTDAKVTLYVYEDNKWAVWDGGKFNQINPQTTLANGEYGFMVPTGRYYLAAEKKGYLTYKGKEFSVDQGKPVNANIQMTKTSSLWWIYAIIGVVIIGGAGLMLRRKQQ